MKRLFLASVAAVAFCAPAFAADMPMKAPAYAPGVNWTGCYFGAEGGGTWGHTQLFDLLANADLTNPFDLKGGLVGGTIGCNWQSNSHWVVGIEDDMSWMHNSGTATNLAVATTSNHLNENWIDTLRGRVGYAWDRSFIYATGGVAFVGTKLTVVGLAGTFSESKALTGWTIGGGIETALAANWSVKAEYLYVGLGNRDYTSMPSPPIDARRVLDLNSQIVRVGLNYKFGSQ